jgi:isocitrate dehydrogenase
MDMIIFRENTEDVYSGIEWQSGSKEAIEIRNYLVEKYGANIREGSGIGIKPISPFGTKRLVRKALKHAIEKGEESVTLVHKGNIMKFTAGAFRDWGYELAKEEFPNQVITEDDLWDKYNGKRPEGMVILNDRIADNMLQQILTRTREYHVIATANLNGDYLSDACAAQVGGLGMAPGGNIGDYLALFETHGPRPNTRADKVARLAHISGVMMFRIPRLEQAADVIVKAMELTILDKTVTYDLERQLENAKLLKCSEFGQAIAVNMDRVLV